MLFRPKVQEILNFDKFLSLKFNKITTEKLNWI